MAGIPVQLFYKNRSYSIGPTSGRGGVITFDLLISEQHNFNNQLSDHNVEDGSVITDHIKNELETGSLVGLITNFSIKTTSVTEVTNRAQTAFDALVSLWQSKELVTIITVMRVYDNVAIAGISVARSATTGEAIEANISFKKIRMVTLQQVQETVSLGGISPPVKVQDTNTDQNKQSSPNLNYNNQQGTTPDKNTPLNNMIQQTPKNKGGGTFGIFG